VNLTLYGKRLIGFTALGTILIALFNGFVDPLLYLNVLSIDGFNAERTSLIDKRSRTAKAAVLQHCPKQVVIFGSSRAQVGLREDFEGYGNRSVYNAALEGSNMYEMKHVLSYSANYQRPELVIVGLDFSGFTESRNITADFTESNFSLQTGGREVTSYLRYLLSPQSLVASWDTIKSNYTSSQPLCSSTSGHLNLSKQAIDHRRAFSNVIANMLVKPGAYAAFRYSTLRIKMLEEAIANTHQENTDILLFFSPIHARQTEVIRGLGLYETYEKWKMDVTKAIENIKLRTSGQGRLELWDFSGYNDITTEEVPPLGSSIKMRWYRESSHYSRDTGDLIVSRLLRGSDTSASVASNFGRIVNQGALVSYLAADREASKRYSKLYPEEIIDVLEVIENTASERKRIERSLGY
jgi:hypothetical protein